ncbi:uclacyanin-3-like [Pistacia vera]|uniref:uclacyanin-3-like n=1 Tax=Pistacia vera TaxID=55513 RepID=UPI00126388F7|nr:uclacyanin-3-like [Pistacia vera]
MAMATAFLFLLLATPAVYAVDYTVGDTSGWTSGFDYTTWVSGKTFKVGDALIFNYGGTHEVDEVKKSDYDNCVSSNAIDSHDDGNTRINLTTVGTKYFICPTAGHCTGGMKLAVTVAASSGTTPNTPATGSPPTAGTPSNTTTPSSGVPSPPSSSSAASTTLCNMMLVIASLVGVAFTG